jgi:acetoin utilization deacetylase AcuC-like enzyme
MTRIPVFYTPEMVSESDCESPSARKPKEVVTSWLEKFPVEIIRPGAVIVDDLARAHDRDWVENVLAGRKPNGFGNWSLEVARALPYTSGAMLAAAIHAIATSVRVAVAPCSGFHHATWNTAQGFCTFNGLMVTALALRARSYASRVGILDLDCHYGNGTVDIMRHLGASTWIDHFTAGLEWTRVAQAEEFLEKKLPAVLASMSKCDVVLYQAGADPHIDDPYGGWLTTAELRKRDAIVFDALRAMNIPVAWNLAGGYQVELDGSIPKVLEIHDNTMRECVRVYCGES